MFKQHNHHQFKLKDIVSLTGRTRILGTVSPSNNKFSVIWSYKMSGG